MSCDPSPSETSLGYVHVLTALVSVVNTIVHHRGPHGEVIPLLTLEWLWSLISPMSEGGSPGGPRGMVLRCDSSSTENSGPFLVAGHFPVATKSVTEYSPYRSFHETPHTARQCLHLTFITIVNGCLSFTDSAFIESQLCSRYCVRIWG